MILDYDRNKYTMLDAEVEEQDASHASKGWAFLKLVFWMFVAEMALGLVAIKCLL